MTILACIAALVVAVAPSPSPTPSQRQSINDAWWTGPLLAPSANTLPRGHILVEPYVYDVMTYGNYDRNGTLQPATHENGFGNLTYIIYGLVNRLSVGLLPTFGYNKVSSGPSSSNIGIGDLGVLAQYRLTPDSWLAKASIAVQETFPTGAYENLGADPNNGFGSGVYSTKVSLYTQTFAWMPNGRIVRLRLNLSQSFSSGASVYGVSVYGTGAGFAGDVFPGATSTIDLAGEYSLTRSWVLASDLVYGFSGNTRLTNAGNVMNLGTSDSFAFAPAVEYNWNANVGIIAGVRLFPAGHNTSASITPVFAINYVH
ncbi:MAG TPA: hypothetical protein VMB20_13585 [Candidatus Acidoferrum sp.]|nr:hypothetical protein [Candidatus Acidoferrum sp.]